MISLKQKALGSILEFYIYDENAKQADIKACFTRIETFENDYSRFKKGNMLWNLNESGKTHLSSELKSLVQLCKTLSTKTQGYFDITLLPLLENAGYGIYETLLPENIGSDSIEITSHEVILHNGIKVDFGSLGKGYMLDICTDILLKKGYTHFTLNFGGDIRVIGKEEISLEDPLREGKILGKLVLEDISFAASSGNKRQFGGKHHILNPKNGESQNDKIALFVTHKLGTFADIYSTALFACPLKLSLKLLEITPGLEGMIIDAQGKIYCSQNFQKNLTLFIKKEQN